MKGEGMRPAAGEAGSGAAFAASPAGAASGRWGPWMVGIVAVGVAVALPAVVSSYQLSLMIRILLFAYLAGAWNILGGFAGQHSLGHSLFLGIGAYTSTWLFAAHGLTPWLGMFIGAAFAAVVGAVVAYICFRYGVEGPYFALVTIALAEAAGHIVINTQSLGAATGLAVPFRFGDVSVMQFPSNEGYYYVALALTLISLAVSYGLLQTRLGYYMLAVRENGVAAEASGVPTLRVKVIATVLSAAMTAIGGTFWAQYYMYIDPSSVFGEGPSVTILLFAVIGGLGTVMGPFLGALLLVPLAEATKSLLGSHIAGIDILIYGSVLVLATLFVRERRGLVDFLPLLWNAVRRGKG